MYPTSSRYQETVAGEHQSVAKCELWNFGQYITDLELVSGSVQVDGGRTVRSSFNLTLASEELVPADEESPLYPATAKLLPYRGAMVDGVAELVPLGVYLFDEVSVAEDSNGLMIQIAANDTSSKLSRTVNTEVVSFARGTHPFEVITVLLQTAGAESIIDLTYSLDTAVEEVVPNLVYQPGTDLWAAAVRIAQSLGKQLYVDRLGQVVMDWVPDLNTVEPVVSYNMDEPGSPVTQFERVVTTAESYNGVVASGEGTDLVRPLSATVWDSNPNSPYYYLGEYGKKPYFYSSPLLLTLGQCESAAAAKLTLLAGGTEMMTWSSWADPSLDVFDVAYLARGKAALDDTFIIDNITIPMDAKSPMTCSGRNRSIITLGEL